MTWNLSASGVVGDVAGALAADIEAELVAELRKVLANPKFHVVSTFFNGSHTGTLADLHVGGASAAPAAEEAPPAPEPAPEAPAPAVSGPLDYAPAAPLAEEPAEQVTAPGDSDA